MGSARKYKDRVAPRLKIDEDQNVLIRFKTTRVHFIQTSRVYDISESGIAFLCSKRLAPVVGAVIKMEVTPFSTLQMACMGRVVRIELPSENSNWGRFPNTVKVGIEFFEMPPAYSKALAQCTKQALKRARKPYRQRLIEVGDAVSPDLTWLIKNGMTYMIGAAVVVFCSLLVYWIITTVQANHTTTQAPWASGFFDKVINNGN